MKVSEAILLAKCDNGKYIFYNKEDAIKFSHENNGEDVVITIKVKSKTAEKLRMYAYYHGPLMDAAVIGYTAAGYPGIDKVKAEYLLRAEFGKDFIEKSDGTYQPIMIDRSSMRKGRFLKYLQDCIFFIEQDLNQAIPDSDEYKMQKATGRKLRRVTSKKDDDIATAEQQFMPPDADLI